MKILKRILGAFLLILGALCVVSFIKLPIDTVKMGFSLSLNLFIPLALYAFIGYQSFKHGYYLVKYGESKKKVSAQRSAPSDEASVENEDDIPKEDVN